MLVTSEFMVYGAKGACCIGRGATCSVFRFVAAHVSKFLNFRNIPTIFSFQVSSYLNSAQNGTNWIYWRYQLNLLTVPTESIDTVYTIDTSTAAILYTLQLVILYTAFIRYIVMIELIFNFIRFWPHFNMFYYMLLTGLIKRTMSQNVV